MRRMVVGLALLGLAGCSGGGTLSPMNPAAMAMGRPVMSFENYGGHGPVTVKMPNGEVLTGSWRTVDNAAVGVAFAGGQSASALAVGTGNTFATAVGPDGTTINCRVQASFGHGAGTCQSPTGAVWQVMF
jgi:hypothetical protein